MSWLQWWTVPTCAWSPFVVPIVLQMLVVGPADPVARCAELVRPFECAMPMTRCRLTSDMIKYPCLAAVFFRGTMVYVYGLSIATRHTAITPPSPLIYSTVSSVRRSRVVNKVAERWTQKALCAAWSTRGARMTEGKRLFAVGAKVCLRLQHPRPLPVRGSNYLHRT